MAAENEGSASSSGDELDGLHYLKPPSWKQRSAVQIIDIQSPVEYNSQNIEQTSSAKDKATNSSKVLLSEEKSTSELQNINVEKSVLESLCGIQHLPSDILEQVSDWKMRPEVTGVASPTSAKQKLLISGELQNRCIEVKDAECQTELTGKLLAGLEKGQDVGSQTISTGDVISLNLYYGNLSSDKLSNTMCDPGNEGLYNCTTLKDIENYEDTFQGNITQLCQTVGCTVEVKSKETQVNEADIPYIHVNESHNAPLHKITRYNASFLRTVFLYVLLFSSVYFTRNAIISTSSFFYKILSST